MKRISIALADDHNMFRKSLKLLLAQEEGLEIAIEADSGHSLLQQLAGNAIDLVILDLQMPELNGIETSQKILDQFPETKILVLTFLQDKNTIAQLVQLGVSGFLTKCANPEELLYAINQIKEGGYYYQQSLRDTILNIKKSMAPVHHKNQMNNYAISERELEIIKLSSIELNNKEIAQKLFLSPRTIERHKENLRVRLNCKNFVGVIIYALTHNLFSFDALLEEIG